MKKILSLLFASVVSMSAIAAVPVSAVTENTVGTNMSVQPRYSYINSISTNLTMNGKKATCTSSVVGMSDVVRITAVQYLEKKSLLGKWTEVDPVINAARSGGGTALQRTALQNII